MVGQALEVRLDIARTLDRSLIQALRELSAGAASDAAFLAGFTVLRSRLAGQSELPSELTFRDVIRRVESGQADASLDLVLRVLDDGIALSYRADLLDSARATEMLDQLELVLRRMIASPDERVDRCSLITARARGILPDPASAFEEAPQEPVAQTIARLAEVTPAGVAMEWRGVRWTFGELEARSRSIGAVLVALGLRPGMRVVLTGTRSPGLVAALLAVWTQGGVIVPIGEGLPADRQRVMAHEAAAGLCIVAGSDTIEWGVPIVRVDPESGSVRGSGNESAVPAELARDAPSYVFFTSGTTGTPKGVLGTHRGLAHFLGWQRERFGVGADGRAAQLTGLSFDVVLRDMLMPLSAGATLCFPPRAAEAIDPNALLVWLREAAITVMHSVPSLLEAWLTQWGEAPPLTSLRVLFMAGEPLSDTLVQQARARFPNCRIINLYGPTETTLAKCFYEVPAQPSPGTQPVGRPMPQTQAIVMTAGDVLCGIGESGEIVIRTPFRTLGYLRTEANARFRQNPYGDGDGDIVYATGDRGRYRLDGAIEILGRVDDQVKIRGVRVEPGEVAATLRTHPSVASCFVTSFTDAEGHKALCAYVVSAPGLEATAGELRTYVAARLPSAMVPGAFVMLKKLPLTPNGKVDRKALPAPESGPVVHRYVAPETPMEVGLAEIVCEVLKLERVGIENSFFDLGGHSLSGARVLARVQDRWNVELPLRALFEQPTVKALAAEVEHRLGQVRGSSTRIERASRELPLPLSFGEARLWFLEEYEPGHSTYNLAYVLRLVGQLDHDALTRAFEELVTRHETLRTRFVASQGQPLRVIDGPGRFKLKTISVEGETLRERAKEARRWAAEEAQRPFDLATGPLFGATLLVLGQAEHVLLLRMHHIVSDGWSIGVLTRDLSEFYGAAKQGHSATLPELSIQYADYAVWQRRLLEGPAIEAQVAYWRERLSGVKVLDLPSDRPRAPTLSTVGATHAFTLDSGLVERLRALGRAEGSTLFMTVLSAFGVLLSRYSGESDLAIGTPVAHRTRVETEAVLGFFVNTLVLRMDLGGNPSVRELLARARETTLSAHANQDVPFERLVEDLQPARDPSRTTLFQVMFTMNTTGEMAALPGLSTELIELPTKVSKFDLTLSCDEREGRVHCGLEYATALFDATTIERMAGHLRVLLAAMTASPEDRIDRLPLLGEAERQAILATGNETAKTYPGAERVHELIEDQAQRSPNTVAVQFEGATLTYQELDRRSNQLANRLRRMGVGREVCVGVCLERSLEMVVALLAVLKAGGAYMPLDTSYPAARLAFTMTESQAPVLLTLSASADLVPASTHASIVLDREVAALAEESPEPLARSGSAKDAVYVIYTSGSTGQPKGVVNVHEGLVNRIKWLQSVCPIGPEDRFLQKTAFGFDVSVAEFFWPLMYGARLVLARPGGHRDPAYLVRTIVETGITAINFVPSMLQLFLEEAGVESCTTLRYVNASGEALAPEIQQRFFERLGARLHNLYGPTEASIEVTFHECSRLARGTSVPIGRPIANTQIYILDKELAPVPLGVGGELHIGGIGLARGYLARPDLTAERFVPNPFGPGRLYKTGDLSRHRPSGEIEYLGRIDQQVKLRGFRIELGEIEAVLAAHPDVAQAVVTAFGDGNAKRLIGYVVYNEGRRRNDAALRTFMSGRLPEYMVPAMLIPLPALPLSANGKLDRKALPTPSFAASQQRSMVPRAPVEEVTAAIWCEVLGLERVGKHDSFFDLGGHSLLATQVLARLRDQLGIEMSVRVLFEHPTVARLAVQVQRQLAGPRSEYPGPAPVRRGDRLPLSSAEARLWFLDGYEPGRAAYSMTRAVRLRGPLDEQALEAALSGVVARHESLRTRFVSEGGEPERVIDPPSPVALERLRLEAFDLRGREAEALALVNREAGRPFDLLQGPLFRATLLRLDEDDHVLLLVMHHIVADAWSLSVLTRELAELYAAARDRRAPTLVDLPIQYADYAAWQRDWLQGTPLQQQLSYWKKRLANLPTMYLPTDRARPPVQTTVGKTYAFDLDESLAEQVNAFSRRVHGTPFMTLLGAFAVLLSRHSGGTDIVVGTPVAHRTRLETEGLVGFFVNTLVLRVDLAGDPTVRELLGRVRETTLSADAHQDVPFERLVEELQPTRDPGRTPLVQVMFAMQNTPDETSLPGLTTELFEHDPGVAKFDLTLFTTKRAGTLQCTLEYNTDLFDTQTIERFSRHFIALLDGLVRDPACQVSELAMLSPEECEQIVVRWNDTATAYPAERSIAALFEEQVRKDPGATAVAYDDVALSYRQLNERANQLSRHLARVGVARGSIVAVCLERSPDMIVAFLAALKVGAAYLPLDPAYPRERLDFMLEDAKAAAIVTESHVACPLREGVPIVVLDRERERLAREDSGDLPTAGTGSDVACVMYTSGSTGKPKGICVPERGIIRLVRNTNYLELGPSDRMAQLSNASFDAAALEIWGALLNGARLVGISKDASLSPVDLAAKIRDAGLTTMFLTTALFNLVSSANPKAFSSLRTLIIGGEACDARAVARVFAEGPPARFLNGYGPTECTTFATFFEVASVDARATSIPIGRPIANTTVFVLDHNMAPVPIGAVGEIYIGGPGLANGYLGRPELTAEKFVPNPFGASDRLYKTGDLGRFLRDGAVDFVGRVDHQVKIRGHRIEPGEVEAVLSADPSIRHAAVLVRTEKSGEKRLIAYVVASGSTLHELRARLKDKLPEYMMPSAFMLLDTWPLTPNGKVDREALARHEIVVDTAGHAPPEPGIETTLAEIWAGILLVEGIGAEDNFFELGGHSLLAARVVARVRDRLHVELTLRALFEQPTVRALAAEVQRRLGDDRIDGAPIERVSRDGPLILSSGEARLWFLDQYEPGRSTYNLSYALRLTGELDHDALARGLEALVARHETLRTRFVAESGEPMRLIDPPGRFTLETIAVEGKTPEERRAEAQRSVAQEAQRPFDLAAGPLFGATLLVLGQHEHVLLLRMHHIVSDGWSIGVMTSDLLELYAAAKEGRSTTLPELSIQYADYAVWERRLLEGAALEAQVAYWKERLSGVKVLDLPTDRPRGPTLSTDGATYTFALESKLVEHLRALGRAEGTTLFMTLLSAFGLLLSRYSGESDIAVGTPVAHRTRVETEALLGFFVNTLVLRMDLGGNPTVGDLLARARETTLSAQAYQDVPFERLVEELQAVRDPSRNPLFQVMFSVNTPGAMAALPGLVVEPVDLPTEVAKFDLTLSCDERDGEVHCALEYATALFDAHTIERLSRHFIALLAGLVRDAACRVSELAMLSPEEREQIVVRWNDTGTAYPAESSIAAIFEEQVRKSPGATAVAYDDVALSYRELNERANQLARHLARVGVARGSIVAVCLERSPDMIVTFLAALKVGAAYLPLDPAYPRGRLDYMLEDAKAAVIVTETGVACPVREGVPTVVLDRERERLAREDGRDLPHHAMGSDVACVMYTSGSTGKPKGICVPQRGLIRLVCQTNFIDVGPSDRMSQVSNACFDAAAIEIWGALLNGARLVGISTDAILSPVALAAKIHDAGLTTMFLTTALFNLVSSANPSAFSSLRTLIIGGEACDARAVARVFAEAPPARFVNAYGPTECSTAATFFEVTSVDAQAKSIPIGRPLANTTIFVLDRHMAPVPIGAIGEVYIGGPGLANGYLGRPELTAEKFVPNPFGVSDRLYGTGDLGRFLPDGAVEFVGRIDHQVKIRGHRIEPGEVEAVLSADPSIRHAAVLVRTEKSGEKRLIAYVVSSESTPHELRARLKDQLPEYMMPSAFMMLDALPLTPNGKVDREALARHEIVVETARHAPPEPGIETTLADIWAGILLVEGIGAEDNFFELGGHSLLAARVVARVRDRLDVELTLRALFEQPTVRALAAEVQRRLGDARIEGSSIERVSREEPLFLSSGEARLWFLDQYEPSRSTYNLPYALRLKGDLDHDALGRGLEALVARHETLRTRFVAEGGEPLRVIEAPGRFKLETIAIEGKTSEERDAEARRWVAKEAQRPFDLASGPLFGATLLVLGRSEHVLFLGMHHIVSDGWSMAVLTSDLSELYAAAKEGRSTTLPELSIQYADYAVWERRLLEGAALEAQVAYWKERLSGVKVLDLPSDRPRGPTLSTDGATFTFALESKLVEHLRALGRAEGTTLFMTLLSAFGLLLSRYSGESDIAVGTPVAHRTRVETEALLGFFVNTLVLRLDLSGNPSVRELLGRVRETTLSAQAHQDIPFERLVEELQPVRDPSRTTLFQVMFTMATAGEMAALPGLVVEPLDFPIKVAKFDLTLSCDEREGQVHCGLEYATALFDASTIERMAGHFEVLLTAIAAKPDTGVEDLSILTEPERAQIVVEWNDAPKSPPRLLPVHELFEAEAAKAPQRIALIFRGKSTTYGELNARANQLARRLVTLGAGPEVLIGVCLNRSIELIVALLAILKSGSAYVPIDPQYPSERREFLLRDTHAQVVVTHPALAHELAGKAPHVVALDGSWTEIAAEESADLKVAISGDTLAYVIYTSGSTGQPKGVLIRRAGLDNYLSWALKTYCADGVAHSPLHSSVSFDLPVTSLWLPLISGGTVTLVEDSEGATKLLEALGAATKPASFVKITPAHLKILAAQMSPEQARGASQAFVIGGDQLLAEDLAFWAANAPKTRLINEYGPTETVVGCCIYEAGGSARPGPAVPIGRPIADTQMYVLDRRMNPVPVGVAGELFIGGAGVARGYLSLPGLTAEKFVPDPFATSPGGRLYRTGDIARYLADGNLEYFGRSDFQVKVRGFRIELGEIEAVLRKHPSIRDAAVLVHGKDSAKRLVAYVVYDEAANADETALRAYMSERLPEYMVPTVLIALPALPLSANGKLERKALLAPEWKQQQEYVAPRNAVEHALAEMWAALLGAPKIGVHDNFFALGGHSLGAARLVAAIRERLGRSVPVSLVFQKPTIALLAAEVRKDAGEASTLVRLREGEGTAIVCVAPIGGEVHCYVDLARVLDGHGPVFGLSAVGLSGERAPLDTVEAIAAHHVAILREAHAGPYLLVGWSFGGIVALEMARQLVLAGAKVGEVIALDSYPGGSPAPDEAQMLMDYRADAGLLARTEIGALTPSFAVYRANVIANGAHVPDPTPLRVRWVRAVETERTSPREVDVARRHWARAVEGRLTETLVDGDHYAILRAPALASVSRLLAGALRDMRGASRTLPSNTAERDEER